MQIGDKIRGITIMDDEVMYPGVVVETLNTQFIADIGGTEVFFFYADKSNTWRTDDGDK